VACKELRSSSSIPAGMEYPTSACSLVETRPSVAAITSLPD
jgi:hypothetical protein